MMMINPRSIKFLLDGMQKVYADYLWNIFYLR